MRVGDVVLPDEATLLQAVEIAAARNLELITNGREFKYAPRGVIPTGFRRFIVRDKNATREARS